MTSKAKSITAVIVFGLTWLNVILNSFGMEADEGALAAHL